MTKSFGCLAIAVMALAGCGTGTQDLAEFDSSEHAVSANLALGRPTVASSVEGVGLEASRAVDGNTATRWSSAYADPQWIRVDLGAQYRLDRVRLVWETAYARAFAVQISNDGVAWTSLYSTTANSLRTNDLTTLAAATGRYLRVLGTQRATIWGYSLYEIEAYGALVAPASGTNLVRGQPATASSVEAAGLEPSRAVDGNGGTRWSSRYADPQWLQIDLGGSFQLNRVRIVWETAYARAFKVQISADGANFSDLFSTTANTSLTNDLTSLPQASGRFLRIAGSQRATVWGYSIWELEAYGTAATTTTPPPPPPAPTGGIVASPVTLSTTSLTAGQTLTGTVTYSNTSASPMTLSRLVITARPPGGTHAGGPVYDFTPVASSITVQPGASYRLQASAAFPSNAPTGTWEVYSSYQGSTSFWTDGPSTTFQMSAPAPTPTPSRFPVIGYYPDWTGNLSTIQYQHVTHIIYSFLHPTASGAISGVDTTRMRSLIDAGHAKGVKVLIAVGGWNNGDDSAFESLAANATARATFVNNMANFVTTYGLDGVDIDWEYPDPGASASNFSLLMRDLSAKLRPMGKLLTFAGGPAYYANAIPTSVWSYIDFANIMAYDCYDCGGQNSPYYFAQDLLNVYLSRGCPKSKAVLGLPFYSSNATVSETVQKTKLAMAQGGGVMIWEISMGPAATLLQAISDTIAGKY